jgi:16S rRNA G966 N2-methylase RsmD
VRILSANLEALEIPQEVVEVRRTDALVALRSAPGSKETYDLVFIDPPYREAPTWGPELSAMLPSLLAPNARVVVESDRRAPLELELPIEREKRYGDTSITIHRQR